jgi:hypothetical protein
MHAHVHVVALFGAPTKKTNRQQAEITNNCKMAAMGGITSQSTNPVQVMNLLIHSRRESEAFRKQMTQKRISPYRLSQRITCKPMRSAIFNEVI